MFYSIIFYLSVKIIEKFLDKIIYEQPWTFNLIFQLVYDI